MAPLLINEAVPAAEDFSSRQVFPLNDDEPLTVSPWLSLRVSFAPEVMVNVLATTKGEASAAALLRVRSEVPDNVSEFTVIGRPDPETCAPEAL
jgi:hypothetical protein